MSLAELEDKGADDFDFEAAWKAVEPDDILTLIYTSGTTGPPKGVQITHGNMVGCVRSYDKIIGFPFGGRIVSYLPMAHVAERNVSQYLPMLCGFNVTACPDARQVAQYLPEVQAVVVLRRAAHLGEDEGRPRGHAGRARRGPAEGGHAGRARPLAEAGQADPGRRGGARRARGAVEAGRRAGALQRARHARPRPGRGLQRGRRADAARGDRVLPRARRAAGRAVGDVGDLRRRHLQPARQDQDRDRRPAGARLRDQARRGRRGADPRRRS